jgi:hypothetical protein
MITMTSSLRMIIYILNLTLSKYTVAIILILILGLGIGYGIGYLQYRPHVVPVIPPVYIHDTINVQSVTHVPIPVLIHDTVEVQGPGSILEQYYTAYTEDIIFEDTIAVTYLSPTFLDTTGSDYFSIMVKPHPQIVDTIKFTTIEYVDQPCPDQLKTITYSAGIGGLVGIILTLLILR